MPTGLEGSQNAASTRAPPPNGSTELEQMQDGRLQGWNATKPKLLTTRVDR